MVPFRSLQCVAIYTRLNLPTIYTPQLDSRISMPALVEHRCAQPRECSFLPKKLMPTNSFFDRLVLGCIRVGKNRAHF